MTGLLGTEGKAEENKNQNERKIKKNKKRSLFIKCR
jgi:hypothetical protein